MKVFSSLLVILLAGYSVDAFQAHPPAHLGKVGGFLSLTQQTAKKSASDETVNQQAFPVGTFVEFLEKNREHVGKITKTEHKSSGGARYQVVTDDGKQYGIADKAITFAINAPNSPGASEKLYQEFLAAHDASEESLQSKLDISPEILALAWEDSTEGEGDHILTPAALVDLVHSHAASAIEKYVAWKILRTDMAHIFFKEIKDHGRVVSFKAKARKAVEAAKQAFCNDHNDSDLCLV